MSWKKIALGEICNIVGGGTPSKSNASFYTGDIPWATVRDMNRDVLDSTDFKITQEAVKESSTNIIPKDNVIIATRVGLGKVCFLKQDTAINQDLRGILPKNKEQLDVNYLFYWFKSIANVIVDAGRGATVHGVTLPFIKSLQIPLPSLTIQKKIVARLELTFVQIEKAADACNANANNAEALFQSYLSQLFERGGTDWIEKKLADITTKIGSGATPKGGNDSYKETGVSLIRSMNVYDEGFYYPKLAFIDDSQAKGLSNVTIEEEDVLLNITGGSIARCCVVPSDVLPARVNQHVSILRSNKNLINPYLLHYLLISPLHKRNLLSVGEAGGTTRQALTKSQLEDYSVKFPKSLDAQLILIEKIKKVHSFSIGAKESYEKKSKEISTLKSSILKQAFNGELVKE